MEITQALHRAAQLEPDRILTTAAGRSRSTSDSRDRISRLAGGLKELGLERDARVAILSLNSDRYHEVLLAVPWAGGIVVPVNTRWSATEIAFSLEDAGAQVLIVDDAFSALLSEIREHAPSLRTVIYAGDHSGMDDGIDYEGVIERSTPAEDAHRGGDDIYGIFYTGGTTGFPKGVMLSHDNVLTSTYGLIATGKFVTYGGRALHAAPLFHLAGVALWLASNIVESAHFFVPAFNPRLVATAIEENEITDLLLVPTMIQMVLDEPESQEKNFSSVTHVIYGASPILDTVLERAIARFPGAGFLQSYGMTEMSPVVTALFPEDHVNPTLRRSAGRAAPHTDVKIVDECDVEVAHGELGEVVARGGNMMLGYWNRPGETASALKGGWMHTGDVGYMDSRGYVFIVDRIKDMIITGGENVYSTEVENVLATHPAVGMCAVIGLPDDKWGERVHAVIVLRPGMTSSLEELTELCRTRIASYKVPRSVSFVDALPLSAAGKILKRDLRSQT